MSDNPYSTGFLEEITKINFGVDDWLCVFTIARAGHTTSSEITFNGHDQITFGLMDGNFSAGGGVTVGDNGGIHVMTGGDETSVLTSRRSSSGKTYTMTGFRVFVGFEWFVDQEESNTWVYFKLDKAFASGGKNIDFTITTMSDDGFANQVDVGMFTIPGPTSKIPPNPALGPEFTVFKPGVSVGKVISYKYTDNLTLFPGSHNGAIVNYPMTISDKMKFLFRF